MKKQNIHNLWHICHVLWDLVQYKDVISIFRLHFYWHAKPRITLPSMTPWGYLSHWFKYITCWGVIQISNYIWLGDQSGYTETETQTQLCASTCAYIVLENTFLICIPPFWLHLSNYNTLGDPSLTPSLFSFDTKCDCNMNFPFHITSISH